MESVESGFEGTCSVSERTLRETLETQVGDGLRARNTLRAVLRSGRLRPTERVVAVALCHPGATPGVLVLTNQRLFLAEPFNRESLDLPLDEIVAYETTMMPDGVRVLWITDVNGTRHVQHCLGYSDTSVNVIGRCLGEVAPDADVDLDEAFRAPLPERVVHYKALLIAALIAVSVLFVWGVFSYQGDSGGWLFYLIVAGLFSAMVAMWLSLRSRWGHRKGDTEYWWVVFAPSLAVLLAVPLIGFQLQSPGGAGTDTPSYGDNQPALISLSDCQDSGRSVVLVGDLDGDGEEDWDCV